jgi:hypothetical protein
VEQNKEKSEIDNYTGISIKVSFNSKADEGQRIQQLSGGQKSLVALATGEPTTSAVMFKLTLQSLPFKNATRRPFTYSTRSTQTSTRNTVPQWRA